MAASCNILPDDGALCTEFTPITISFQQVQQPEGAFRFSSGCYYTTFYQLILMLYEYISSLSTLTLLLGIALLLPGIVYCLYNLIAWYKFLAAWNLISRARRMDTRIARRRRRQLSFRQMKNTQVHVDCMKQQQNFLNCPICLVDFYEREQVTACEEGCGNWFHRECLFRWLEESEQCPCCRKDLLQPQRRGWLYEIVVFLGLGR